MRVAIRTDASAEIGSGHLMRCLALADALALRKMDVTFISRATPDNLLGLPRGHGHATAEIATRPDDPVGDAAATYDVLRSLGGVDWLLVDHYGLDATWETAQQSVAQRILAIDDRANRAHACDILLDQNLVADMDTRYRTHLGEHTVQLLGPRYALLRAQFIAARNTLRVRDGALRRILVMYGGSDPGGETAKALDAIEMAAPRDIHVDVVVGANYRAAGALRARLASWPNARLLQQVSEVAALMASADLALGAGGISTWERACLALPTIATAIADNQEEGLNRLAAQAALINLGPAAAVTSQGLADALTKILKAPSSFRLAMGAAAAALVDGQGCERVVAAIEQMGTPSLRLRPANMDDAASLLAWRNAPAVRQSSLTRHEIGLAEHTAWLEHKLADRTCLMWIAEIRGKPTGVIRFDRDSEGALVSIATSPESWGQGWGSRLLHAGCTRAWSEVPDMTHVDAIVLQDNARSKRLFANSGFTLVRAEGGKLCYRLARPQHTQT